MIKKNCKLSQAKFNIFLLVGKVYKKNKKAGHFSLLSKKYLNI